jgi:hypothetical protein
MSLIHRLGEILYSYDFKIGDKVVKRPYNEALSHSICYRYLEDNKVYTVEYIMNNGRIVLSEYKLTIQSHYIKLWQEPADKIQNIFLNGKELKEKNSLKSSEKLNLMLVTMYRTQLTAMRSLVPAE